MFEKVNKLIVRWEQSNPWTNVYGLARSIIALASMLTLIFNSPEILFKPAAGIENFPSCRVTISAFCIGQNHYVYLNIIRWICVFLLFLVVIGWRPRITGIIHWYISYSLQSDFMVIDGGEQAAAVITFLLIPITLTDARKWHWDLSKKYVKQKKYSKIIAHISYFFIRLQVAIIYFHSSMAKLKNEEWINGTAVYYYTRDYAIGFNSFFDTITHWVVSSPFIVIPTWGTLIVQLVIFCALFSPIKYWKNIFVLATVMHEIFAIMLGLISFSMIMLGVLILYLTPIDSQIKTLNPKNNIWLDRVRLLLRKDNSNYVQLEKR